MPLQAPFAHSKCLVANVRTEFVHPCVKVNDVYPGTCWLWSSVIRVLLNFRKLECKQAALHISLVASHDWKTSSISLATLARLEMMIVFLTFSGKLCRSAFILAQCFIVTARKAAHLTSRVCSLSVFLFVTVSNPLTTAQSVPNLSTSTVTSATSGPSSTTLVSSTSSMLEAFANALSSNSENDSGTHLKVNHPSRRKNARVLCQNARCPHFGEGILYWLKWCVCFPQISFVTWLATCRTTTLRLHYSPSSMTTTVVTKTMMTKMNSTT